MATQINMGIQLESKHGYYVTIKYYNGVIFETHCSVNYGGIPIHHEPYDATEDEWEQVIEWNRRYIENKKKELPNSKFFFSLE